MIDEVVAVADAQVNAYNKRDIEAWLDAYAADAEQYDIDGNLLARGHEEMRARMTARFLEPDLQARILQRVVMGNVVVEYEEVTRNFPEGVGTQEMLCIYKAVGGKYVRATFAFGKTVVRA